MYHTRIKSGRKYADNQQQNFRCVKKLIGCCAIAGLFFVLTDCGEAARMDTQPDNASFQTEVLQPQDMDGYQAEEPDQDLAGPASMDQPVIDPSIIDRLFENIRAGDLDAVKQTIEAGISINIQDEFHWTLVMEAIYFNKTRIINYLISHGADIKSALIIAAFKGNIAAMNNLLENNADVNESDETGLISLKLSYYGGFIDEATCQNYPDNGIQDYFKDFSPLFWAAYQGFYEAVIFLSGKGADVNHRSVMGYTPLMLACESCSHDIAELLLRKGAEINVRDMETGNTALIRAAENNDIIMVSILLDYDAEIQISNDEGKNALIIALENDYNDIYQLLLNN